jgi:hypothetical protein
MKFANRVLTAAFLLGFGSSPCFAERPSEKIFGAYSNSDGSTVYLFEDLDNGKLEQVYLWYMPQSFEVDLLAFDYEVTGTSARLDMNFLSTLPLGLKDNAAEIKKLAASTHHKEPSQVFLLPMKVWDGGFSYSPLAERFLASSLTAPEDGFDAETPLRFFGTFDLVTRNRFAALAKRGIDIGSLRGTIHFYAEDGKLLPQDFVTPLFLKGIPSCKISPNGCQ